ncbi:MAG: protein kinase, partial [Myxococcales bacterium]|nr:protein kinase [Myxococcales bacterium]
AVALLHEAWITGAVEHPNIVPLYDVSLDARGFPLVVLKRIEGTSWRALLESPAAVRERFGVADEFEWHLRTFMQVCAAAHFAHSRGIIHRDLKPDNVMIGAYGEVYLVDWGLAGTFRGDAPPWLPRVNDLRGLVGTPVYMAPEQVHSEPDTLGPATDVYQLGGILYELVTGQRPRLGSPLKTALMASRGVVPDLSGLPAGLRAICARALDPEPTARYPNAGAFAQALRDHLQHHEAERLADEGWQRLQALRAATPQHPVAIERLGAECAFAFEQALQVWPESAAAHEGRHALVLWQVGRDLEADAPEAAEAHLARLTDPPIDLVVRVKKAKAARQAREAEAERLRLATDRATSRQARVYWLWLIGAIWVLWNVACGLVDRHVTPVTYPILGGLSAAAFGLWLIGRHLSRRHLADTPFNRRAVAVVGTALGVTGFLWFGGWSMGLTVHAVVAASTALYLLFAALMALWEQPQLWRVAAVTAALSVCAGLWPQYAFEWAGLCGGVAAFGGALIWSGEEARDRQRRARPTF